MVTYRILFPFPGLAFLRKTHYNGDNIWQSRMLRVKCPEDGELSLERKKVPFCRAVFASRCRIWDDLLYVATSCHK